jgi:hypothetical protein
MAGLVGFLAVVDRRAREMVDDLADSGAVSFEREHR